MLLLSIAMVRIGWVSAKDSYLGIWDLQWSPCWTVMRPLKDGAWWEEVNCFPLPYKLLNVISQIMFWRDQLFKNQKKKNDQQQQQRLASVGFSYIGSMFHHVDYPHMWTAHSTTAIQTAHCIFLPGFHLPLGLALCFPSLLPFPRPSYTEWKAWLVGHSYTALREVGVCLCSS